MKKRSILYGALGVMAIGLAGCSNEMPVNPGNGTAENDEVRYLRVAIATPPGTRAATFENGTDEENTVDGLYFKFYDAAGNPLPDDQITVPEDNTFSDASPANGNVGKIKDMVVQLSLPRGANYPSYVVCFINPVNYDEINDDVNSMTDLRNQIRTDYKDNDGNFAMNNSVYYGADPISGGTNVKILGAPIQDFQLLTSQDGATNLQATSDTIVNIYVERYAAKVRFTLANKEGETGYNISPMTVGAYTLTFVPEAWTVNADAPEMYAAKRFEDTNTTGTAIPTYNQVQNMLGNWTTWNDAAHHRSYWACSPGFYASEFPQVSDDLIDNAETGSTGAGVVVPPYALRYYSYNQVMATTGSGAGVTAFNNGGTNWKYTMENTMGAPAFNSLNPSAAAPSVILVGHYDIATTATNTTLTTADGFCVYNGEIYFRNKNNDNVPAGAAEGAMTMRKKFLQENKILAINSTGTLLNPTNAAENNLAQYFEVAHPSKDVRGTQPVPHRYVTLQIKKDATIPANSLYYKRANSDTWQAVATADDITYVNTLLWQQLGNASSYTQNKCYYSIPIRHLGFTENTDGEPLTEDGKIDWANVRVGDFGLVRNHVYSLEVSEITGRANGIENLDNPLVPSMDETNYWIRYQINILNWRVVPTQGGIKL